MFVVLLPPSHTVGVLSLKHTLHVWFFNPDPEQFCVSSRPSRICVWPYRFLKHALVSWSSAGFRLCVLWRKFDFLEFECRRPVPPVRSRAAALAASGLFKNVSPRALDVILEGMAQSSPTLRASAEPSVQCSEEIGMFVSRSLTSPLASPLSAITSFPWEPRVSKFLRHVWTRGRDARLTRASRLVRTCFFDTRLFLPTPSSMLRLSSANSVVTVRCSTPHVHQCA